MLRLLFRPAANPPASKYAEGGAVALVAGDKDDGSDLGPASPQSAGRLSPAGRPRPPFLTFARKLLLTFMGLGLVSAIVGSTLQGTRSSFTASTANSGNTFAVGTLLMTNDNNNGTVCSQVVLSNCGSIPFSTGHLQPGAVYQQTVKITNSGTLPASMSLQVTNINDNPVNGLKAFVNLTIHDDTKSICLYGTAGSMNCDPLANVITAIDPLTAATSTMTLVGTTRADQRWNPAEQHSVTFSIEIDTQDCTGFSPAPGPAPNPPPAVGPTTSSCDLHQASFDVVWTGLQ